MTQQKIAISGMTCGHCVAQVQKALKGVDGVKVDEVKLGEATVSYDPANVSPSQLTQAIEDQGYVVAAA